MLAEYPIDRKNLIVLLESNTNARPEHGKGSYGSLPDTPKVIVRGKELFIVNNNGTEEFWGSETDGNIEEIASKMEMELRAVKWVKHELERIISDLTEIISYTDIPSDRIPNIIFEGYRSLLFSFKRIDE